MCAYEVGKKMNESKHKEKKKIGTNLFKQSHKLQNSALGNWACVDISNNKNITNDRPAWLSHIATERTKLELERETEMERAGEEELDLGC